MDLLRTPDECFENLVGLPWAPRYAEVDAGDGSGPVRMAYLDEGPADAPVVLLLHGEPSWSYLYRHMIPPLLDAGLRVVAPDLVGFGRSDKPAHRDDCTYQRHADWLRGLVFGELDLHEVTLFCQDWGGLLGLRLVGEHPDRFARVLASNTFLPTGERDLGDGFRAWRDFSQRVETFPVGFIVNGGCVTDLPEEVVAAYDAPFPDEASKEAARQFPMLVPASTDDPASPANLAAWEVLRRFARPFRCAFGDKDPVTAGADRVLIRDIPGAAGQPHRTIAGGGHFIQEDQGPELAAELIDLITSTPEAGSTPALVD
ncbi:MAG: haloalkane dehalogenase [Acidimicrobiales bacterium]